MLASLFSVYIVNWFDVIQDWKDEGVSALVVVYYLIVSLMVKVHATVIP